MLKQQWTLALDFLFPRVCCSCQGGVTGEQASGLCWDCRISCIPIEPPLCACCGMSIPGRVDHAFTCSSCTHDAPGYDRARSLYRYEGPVRDAIHALKYQRNLSVVQDLATLLHAGIQTVFPENASLVPIPLHPKKQRKRGFNQSELLVKAVPGRDHAVLLRRVKNTETQTHLTAAQRRTNVRGAFEVRKAQSPIPESVILVDDVMTTGATLDAASRALKKAGVKQIGAITLARG